MRELAKLIVGEKKAEQTYTAKQASDIITIRIANNTEAQARAVRALENTVLDGLHDDAARTITKALRANKLLKTVQSELRDMCEYDDANVEAYNYDLDQLRVMLLARTFNSLDDKLTCDEAELLRDLCSMAWAIEHKNA